MNRYPRYVDVKASPTVRAPAGPFLTQKAQLSQLKTRFDATHGSGAADRLIASNRGKNGMTLKTSISLLQAQLTKPPKAKTNLEKPGAPIPITAAPVTRNVAPTPQPATANVMFTDEFLALEPFNRGQFQAAGGKVVARKMSRGAFDKLPPDKQSKFCREGGKLVD